MRTISIGNDGFDAIREKNCFYVDKTAFIREWWESEDKVTLIARPRRFGKTLNMNMLECFFSMKYKGRGDLFEGLSIWSDDKYRNLQGTCPVISLTFADVKSGTCDGAIARIKQNLTDLYNQNEFLLKGDLLNAKEREQYDAVRPDMKNEEAEVAVRALMGYLSRYYGKKVIVLLDEYDTPLQEAYANGFWEEMSMFIRSMFHSMFKTNPYLERAMLTGITRVSKESIFSDLNNLQVVTTTSCIYENAFGFTEDEVFAALKEAGILDRQEQVKAWYDGFTFGKSRDIYNPWSITKYLDEKRFAAYWANTSSNNLVSNLIREGASDVKIAMEDLIEGKSIEKVIDEEIIFEQLDDNSEAIWSLLLAAGYLKVEDVTDADNGEDAVYRLSLTNLEVRKEFRKMVQGWFKKASIRYHDFVEALLANDVAYMNQYMNRMTQTVFSYFDTGNHPSEQTEPERFYHGFVLGLIVDAKLDYHVTSNRESGLGRYDVVMEPRDKKKDAFVFEFKVKNQDSKESLEDTVRNALKQIEEKNYDAMLIAKGIPKERIRHYGFAFEGKRVLIG
ncbi:MAG: AAA family ATPase [Dorea sp.]|nr:AAA family ATPase [Dorea sp.]MCI9452959.1 AAA family ATPase [Dorea sp.]